MRLGAYASLARRILATRMGSVRPFKVTWSLTDRCDCRCHGCLIWARPKRREPTPEEVGRTLASVPEIRWVNLTGGELFLRPDVVDVVQAVHEALPRLVVLDFPTTGQRTDRIVADVTTIARRGIPQVLVTVSIEGPPGLHDRLRGRTGAFDRAVGTFAALRAVEGVRVWLGMTLTRENEGTLEATLAAVAARLPSGARPVGWGDLHLNAWVRSPHYYANVDSDVEPARGRAPGLARARREREGSTSPIDRIEATWLRLLPAYLATGRSPVPCRSLSASVFIATNGDVHPCTVWSRRLGNVLEQPLARILASPDADDARGAIARDACPGCWSPCEAYPTIVASAPASLARGLADVRRRGGRQSRAQ